ncbi:MAG: helix-turn-helix domain-containing protein [Desulfitobacteriia bacterium]
MKDQVKDAQRRLAESFQSLCEEQELLAKVIEFFPYPIQIFSLDGTARLINKATLEMIGIKSLESHVGKYNVFKDPIVHGLGVMEQVRQVLTGKTVYLTDFNAPYQDMIRYHNVEDRDIQTISADITCFPLVRADGAVEYFAAVFILKKIYRGKEEIRRGKQYIETHWLDPFDAGATARAACLSKAHFIKLFKKHTGITPHEYYINYKISKMKEKLLDANLSIAQAFAACNMEYNGHSAKVFKEKTGLSPSAYRKMLGQNESSDKIVK